jgi:hypothetical protein
MILCALGVALRRYRDRLCTLRPRWIRTAPRKNAPGRLWRDARSEAAHEREGHLETFQRDFDTSAPADAGTSPSGSRTARRNFRVEKPELGSARRNSRPVVAAAGKLPKNEEPAFWKLTSQAPTLPPLSTAAVPA